MLAILLLYYLDITEEIAQSDTSNITAEPKMKLKTQKSVCVLF